MTQMEALKILEHKPNVIPNTSPLSFWTQAHCHSEHKPTVIPNTSPLSF